MMYNYYSEYYYAQDADSVRAYAGVDMSLAKIPSPCQI